MFDLVYIMIEEFMELLPYLALLYIVLDVVGSIVFKRW